MRKPAPFKVEGTRVAIARSPIDFFKFPIHIAESRYAPAEARRLAAWLNKAATWVEGKKK